MDISYNQEIELDGNGFPTKITDLGAFQITSEGYKKVWDGKYYYALTFEPSTKNLLKLEKFNLEDSTLITTSSFQYSDQPGSMSQVELPLWFFSYHSLTSGISSRQYLNYRNTLTEETVTDGKTGNTHTTYYKYTYNKNAYPVAVDNGEEKMDIRY